MRNGSLFRLGQGIVWAAAARKTACLHQLSVHLAKVAEIFL
jgi:hypothetical protein